MPNSFGEAQNETHWKTSHFTGSWSVRNFWTNNDTQQHCAQLRRLHFHWYCTQQMKNSFFSQNIALLCRVNFALALVVPHWIYLWKHKLGEEAKEKTFFFSLSDLKTFVAETLGWNFLSSSELCTIDCHSRPMINVGFYFNFTLSGIFFTFTLFDIVVLTFFLIVIRNRHFFVSARTT